MAAPTCARRGGGLEGLWRTDPATASACANSCSDLEYCWPGIAPVSTWPRSCACGPRACAAWPRPWPSGPPAAAPPQPSTFGLVRPRRKPSSTCRAPRQRPRRCSRRLRRVPPFVAASAALTRSKHYSSLPIMRSAEYGPPPRIAMANSTMPSSSTYS